jgi:hypothetical protein
MLTSSSSTHSETTRPAGEEAQPADIVPGTCRSRAVVLTAEVAALRGETVVLTPGRWGIGSADTNQIVIDHETVAPRHAMIIVTEHRVLVTSWSTGTYVNGERCRESLLCPGDVLTIGTVDLKLRAAHSSELISQVPEVNAVSDRLAVIHPVSAEETLRRLDDLDTALELLDEELAGSDESADQLNELIDQIETDIARRSDDSAQQAEALSLSEDQHAPSEEQHAEPAWHESARHESSDTATVDHPNDDTIAANVTRPFSLDELMNEVVTGHAETQADSHSVEPPFFDNAQSEFAEDQHTSEADEFAQLVGSTSVLAQNLTLNALRSRAEAVRQLDEMILAASGNNSSLDRMMSSERTSTSASGNAASEAAGHFSEQTEYDRDADEPLTEHPSGHESENLAGEDGFFPTESSFDNPTTADDRPIEDAAESDTQSPEADSDTVEISAMDTVNEAGSLLALLFREEASDQQSALVEQIEPDDRAREPEVAAPDTAEPVALLSDSTVASSDSDFDHIPESGSESESRSVADSVGQTDPGADQAGTEDVSGVRSRLAEMFDLPGLKSASPQPFEVENELSADPVDSSDPVSSTESDSDFGPLDAAPQSEFFRQCGEPVSSIPTASKSNLTTWLDGVRSDQSAQSEKTADMAGQAEADCESPVSKTGSLSRSSVKLPGGDQEEHKAQTEDDGDDSIAAYMQALLARNRVRQGQPERPGDYVVLPTASGSATASGSGTGADTASEFAESGQDVVRTEAHEQFKVNSCRDTSSENDAQSWLSQEPKHQLDKDRMRADTQALREVANATARSAVSRATRRQLKVQVVVKTAASVLMLGCGIAASLLGVSSMFTALAVGVGACFAFDLGLTIVRNWKCITA